MNRKKTNEQKARRGQRVRTRVRGTAERPRLTVFRSLRQISVQLIDDRSGHTIAAARGKKSGASASEVGALIARKGLEKKINRAVFDRGGYRYHGTVRAVAEAVRKGGLAL